MSSMPPNQPPQFNPPQPVPPYPPYQPVPYPPPKKGPSALKIVLIVVAIFVGLGLIAVGVVGYGIYKFAKSSNVSTSTQPVSEADLGVAIYPGADDKANIRMTVMGKNTLTATFLTSDSKDQVVAFYQSKLCSNARSSSSGNSETFMLDKGNGESVLVTITQSSTLSEGKTQIVIVHATSASASQSGSTS
jgi:hypothetical protein